eukprot:279613_1
MTRHGERTHSKDIQTYFPNNTQYYHCNISTITSRIQYADIDSTNNQYFVSMHKKYEYDNQYLKHSNCQRMQSYKSLINQHKQNAQILIKAYMNNNNASKLFNIYETNQQSNTEQFIKVYTSNKERCMMSTLVLISTLLNISSSNQTLISPTIETITNDLDMNPYTPINNYICTQNEQFNQWNNKYIDDISNNYIQPKHDNILLLYADAIDAYIKAGGIMVNSTVFRWEDPGFQVTFYYCNGLDIPLANHTFWRLVDESVHRFSAIHPDKNSADKHEQIYAEKKQCYNHFLGIPMYKRYFDDIYALINGDVDYKKFILHSAHDSSIAWFLNGLGLHDGIIPYFAQMFTLEIYSASRMDEYNIENDIKYLFRWTNKGEFVPYEYCANEYMETNGQLCDLNILLENGFKDVNITQRYWAENKCKTMLDDCVCGYCNENKNEDNSKWMFEEISFVIGLLSGFVLLGLVLLMIKCLKKKWTTPQRNYQEALDGSDIELDEKPTVK